MEEHPHAIVALRRRAVVEVDGAEEAVLAGVGHEEVCERPLDCDDHGDKDEAGDERDLPKLPGSGALPEEVEREGGGDEKDGELGRNEMRDREVDGAEFGLSGEERKDEDEGDDGSGV